MKFIQKRCHPACLPFAASIRLLHTKIRFPTKRKNHFKIENMKKKRRSLHSGGGGNLKREGERDRCCWQWRRQSSLPPSLHWCKQVREKRSKFALERDDDGATFTNLMASKSPEIPKHFTLKAKSCNHVV